MKTYRKKPVTIQAMQWDGSSHRPMFDFLDGSHRSPANGTNFYIDHSKVEGGLVIKTLEGEHIANIGDYIIKGVKGEFYPCKPDIFAVTYDEVSFVEHEQQPRLVMPKKYTPLRPIKVEMICDDCKDGQMTPTGIAYMSHPAKYPHQCEKCGYEKNFNNTYPIIEYCLEGELPKA